MRIGPYAFSGVSPLASVSLFNVDFYEINECETSTGIYPFGTRTVKKMFVDSALTSFYFPGSTSVEHLYVCGRLTALKGDVKSYKKVKVIHTYPSAKAASFAKKKKLCYETLKVSGKMEKVEQTNLTAYNYVLGRISPALLAKPAERRFFNNNYDSLLLFRAIIISIQCWCGTPPLLQSNTTSSILWKYQS